MLLVLKDIVHLVRSNFPVLNIFNFVLNQLVDIGIIKLRLNYILREDIAVLIKQLEIDKEFLIALRVNVIAVRISIGKFVESENKVSVFALL